MFAVEAIKKIMEIRDIRNKTLCDRLKIKSNVLSERLKQTNISVSKLDEMARVMDYKIVLMPSDAPTPKGGFEIE